jgi:hypothetical protein
MESEQSQNFNDRLSQWVSNQGFWFQVRYSMSGNGMKGAATYHILKLGARLLVFLLIATAAYWVYLVKRTGSPDYQDEIRTAMQSGLSGDESEISGFSESQGQLTISRFSCEGGPGTFFSSLEARNIRLKKGLLDGMTGIWNPGTVSVFRLDMDLRAGADDAESAQKISDSLFKRFDTIELNNIEVADASIRWGYSERTRGSIVGSVMKVQRLDNGLKLQFQGGTFSQNWLKRLEIVNLVISCDREGMVFEKAEFRQAGGTVDFSGLRVLAGERPTIKGLAKIRGIDIENLVPAALRSFVQGSISGDFQVSGSTNTTDGVGFDGMVTMNGQDVVTLRERIYLLKALSVVDYVRNYYRADFREGSFELKTGGGGMTISNLSLKAGDLLTLDGEMKVRPPTEEESRVDTVRSRKTGGAPLFAAGDEEEADVQEVKDADADFTLRRAAQEARREGNKENAEAGKAALDRLGMNQELRRLAEQASERLSKTLRYEGSFKISLLPDAFDRAARLAAQYPVDLNTGRIPLTVPVEGSIYDITLKQAEEIYQQGSR